MSVQEHRIRLYDTIPEGSMILSYAGVPVHTNEDDYYPFEANSQFFYLTGLERENMAFLAVKAGGATHEILFIEARELDLHLIAITHILDVGFHIKMAEAFVLSLLEEWGKERIEESEAAHTIG